jgi:DNA-binding NtrC family response regulator
MINEKNISNAIILKHLEQRKAGFNEANEMDTARYLQIRNYKDSIAEYERDYFSYHLERNHWQVSKTAREIGIERSTLYKKIKQLGIYPAENEEI